MISLPVRTSPNYGDLANTRKTKRRMILENLVYQVILHNASTSKLFLLLQ